MVTTTIRSIAGIGLEILPAFSLVTAVDYFPQVEQAVIIEWLEKKQQNPIGLSDPEPIFPQGGPQPLCDGRFRSVSSTLRLTGALPNSELVHPLTAGAPAFPVQEAANLTATAVVGFRAKSASSVSALTPPSGARSTRKSCGSGAGRCRKAR